MSRCMKYARLGFYLSHGEINEFIDTIKKDPNKKHTSENTYEGF